MRSARAHLPKPRNTMRGDASAMGGRYSMDGARVQTWPGVRRPCLFGQMPCKRCQTPTSRDEGVRKSLLEERVFVGVWRRAVAEEAQLAVAVVLQRVPGAGGDQDGVARADHLAVAVDLHPAGALQDEVDLLRCAVVVALRGLV